MSLHTKSTCWLPLTFSMAKFFKSRRRLVKSRNILFSFKDFLPLYTLVRTSHDLNFMIICRDFLGCTRFPSLTISITLPVLCALSISALVILMSGILLSRTTTSSTHLPGVSLYPVVGIPVIRILGLREYCSLSSHFRTSSFDVFERMATLPSSSSTRDSNKSYLFILVSYFS